MFYVPRGLMKRFSGGFLISISLPATDLECLIRNLIFNSLKSSKTMSASFGDSRDLESPGRLNVYARMFWEPVYKISYPS